MINTSVSINIERGQSLTQALDKRLDAEFGTDITLGKNEWVSVFNILKEDQADANNKAFSDNNFEGLFEITEKAWTKIKTFVKGFLFHEQEANFATGNSDAPITIDGVQEAIDAGDMNAFKAAFHQKAKEYIAYYDENENGKIDFEELVGMEEKELGRALTTEEQKVVIDEAVNFMSVINQDDDFMSLDEQEISAYLWAMSKIRDGAAFNNGVEQATASTITAAEWNITQESLGVLSGTDMTDEEWGDANLAFSLIKKSGKTLDELYVMDNLSSINKLTEAEKTFLTEMLPVFKENGFNQEMIDNYAILATALRTGYENL